MFPPKFRLTDALSLAIASLAFLAVTLNAAKARETHITPVAPLKAKILRRKDKLKDQPDAVELARLSQTAQEAEERKLEDEIPKHVPIKFKLKGDKEKKFKDLKNPGWYRDFELEVTNKSDKPIYYLELWLMYAEIEAAPGVPLAVPLRYGRMNFIYQETRPQPTDVPIQPGETYVFTVPEGDRRGWEAHKKRDNIPDRKKVILEFVHLSFGDGTGFATSGAKPYPFRRDQSLSPSCRGKPRPIVAVGGPFEDNLFSFQATAGNRWVFAMTARNTGGQFSVKDDSYSFIRSFSTSTDGCCGSGCYFMKPEMESCSCGDSPGNSYPACTDPQGTCGRPQEAGHWCEGLEVYCPQFRILVCTAGAPTPPPAPSPSATPASPTPTPTPTPEPTCNPATKPNNTNCVCNTVLATAGAGEPFWDCGIGCSGATGADYHQYPGTPGYGGCPANKYNDGRDCCHCIETTCANGQSVDALTCQCPSPSPTPTQSPVISGGGGGYEGDGFPCTDYYWVYYVSYDGRHTWVPTGEYEYAGCW